MGKKARAAPGRRPILQLSPPAPRRDEAAGPAGEGGDSGSEPGKVKKAGGSGGRFVSGVRPSAA